MVPPKPHIFGKLSLVDRRVPGVTKDYGTFFFRAKQYKTVWTAWPWR
jgi:hypothetical protein